MSIFVMIPRGGMMGGAGLAAAITGLGIGLLLQSIPAHAASTQPGSAPRPSPSVVTKLAWAEARARPVLRNGSRGPWVLALQSALRVTPLDGSFGPITGRAVRAFRASVGIRRRSIVNAATWRELGSRVVPPVEDVTLTQSARTSREARSSVGLAAFLSSWTARLVIRRESGGDCAAVSPRGTYRGKWQMDADFWSYYGGKLYAPRPDLATCAQQDAVAFRGWVDRWWQPWPTAGI